jgi:lipopolysaccharide export system permease protein
MYILTRYVIIEILKIFLLTLTGITLLVTMGMGIKEGTNFGCPMSVILRLMPYMLPEMLVITIPVSLLLAVSIVYGRMTGSNEVVALKALGISPMDVLWPTIVMTLIFSIATLYLQELAATWGRPSVLRTVAESVEEIAYGALQKNKYCKIEGMFSIAVQKVEGKDLIGPWITIIGRGNNPTVTIKAAKAYLETDLKSRTIVFRCWDSNVEAAGRGSIYIPGMKEVSLAIPDPGRDEFHRDWVAMHEIPDKLAQLNRHIYDLLKQREGILDSLQANPEKKEELTKQLGVTDETLRDRWWQFYRLQTEPYRRLSNGFTCLCFALIGAPVAMLWRHADVLTNFFVCFLPILAIYYPLLMIGEKLSTSGALWPISFWIGNVTLIVPGVFLIKWVVKH